MPNKKIGLLIGVAFALVFAAILTFSLLSLRRHRVEVCIEFRGRSECRQASGANRDEAIRTATDAACTMLASGMTESMQCGRTNPSSLKDLQ
jgi:hypothetical protein